MPNTQRRLVLMVGTKRQIMEATRQVVCWSCHGGKSVVLTPTPEGGCAVCNGAGYVDVPQK